MAPARLRALMHFAKATHLCLDETLPGQRIGCSRHTEESARLPDLTPMDFSLCGCLKSSVYNNQPYSTDKLNTRYDEGCTNIMQDMLCHVTIRLKSNMTSI
jgi:hypothetical protein